MIATSKGDTHTKAFKVRELTEKLLADKSQIEAFMSYDKKKKEVKIKAYQTSVRQKLRSLEDQKK